MAVYYYGPLHHYPTCGTAPYSKRRAVLYRYACSASAVCTYVLCVSIRLPWYGVTVYLYIPE